MMTQLLLSLLACATVTTLPPTRGALHGTPPPSPLAAPTFVVSNQAEEPRSRDSLLGHPTVLWFYPMAGTPG